MKRLNNKEFRLGIQNILSSEEHLIDMLINAEDEYSKNAILDILKNTKKQRNNILDFPEEKDRNKWCYIKHILLSLYHVMELINQNDIEHTFDINSLSILYKNLELLLESAINDNIKTNCNICKDDLLSKIKRGVGLS